MLKRLAILVLVPLYLITAMGFAISLHYCGKLLTGFEIDAPVKKCVTLGQLKCCKDKQIKVKLKDAHQSTAFVFKANNSSIHVPRQQFIIAFNVPVHPLSNIYFNKAPPDACYQRAPIFLQNRSFLI